MNRMILPPASREATAPPLRLAQACLGSVYSRRGVGEARDLFHAGSSLWAVILEVDNSEARSIEMLVAVGHTYHTVLYSRLILAEYITVLVWSSRQ